MAEFTEDCCWNDIREHCKGNGCPCGCHEVYPENSLDEASRLREEIAGLRSEMERYRQRSRDEDTARIRLNHERVKYRDALELIARGVWTAPNSVETIVYAARQALATKD